MVFVEVIAWLEVIFGIIINSTSDISKLLYVISRAVRLVKFKTILKYHSWYLCQISRTLSQSNCRNFSCSSITLCVTREKGGRIYIQTLHDALFFRLQSFSRKKGHVNAKRIQQNVLMPPGHPIILLKSN